MLLRNRARAATGLAVLALLALAAAPAPAQTLAIVGGAVHTGDGQVHPGGTVVIEDGRITAVGVGAAAPGNAAIIDAAGMVVTPGLIDSLTLVGPGGAPTHMHGEVEPDIQPTARARERFHEGMAPGWLRDGVTAVYMAPDPSRLIGGIGAVVKLAGGAETAVVAETASLAASFGESVVGDQPPGPEAPTQQTTRQGMIYRLRQTLVRAQEDAFTGETARVFGELLSGELPFRMLANNPDDIGTALRLAGEFELRLVVDQGAGAAMVAARLAEAGVPVVVGPAILGIGDGGPMELYAHTPATPARLHEAGVRLALSTFSQGGRSVTMEAGIAWAHGLPREAALLAVTGHAAAILGVEDRIGTLAPGRDADVVIWDQHPIGAYGRAMRVLVDGRTVFER